MDFRDKTSYSINKKVTTVIVLGILVLVNILSLRYFLRFDWTANEQYSISDSTVSMLQEMDDIVTVKAYFSENLPPQFLQVRQYVRDILSEYQAYSHGNLEYEFVDPSKSAEVAQEVQKVGVQAVRMQVRENDSFQVQNGFLGMGIFYQGKSEAIPVIEEKNLGNLEYDLTSLILKLTQPRTMVVGFLQGHGEQSFGDVLPTGNQMNPDEQYNSVKHLLSKNYDVKKVDFAKQQTLEGIDVLVVAGPKRDLTPRDLFEVDQYLLRGGKAIFLIDAIEQLDTGINIELLDTNVRTMLANLGVTVDSNIMMDQLSELTNFSEGPGRFYFLQYPPFIRLVKANFTQNPIVAKVESFVVRFISSLAVEEKGDLDYDRFANTSPGSWYQDYPFQLNPQALPPASPENGGAKPVGVMVTGLMPRISAETAVPPLQKWEKNLQSGDYELKPVSGDKNRTGREILTEAEAESKVIVFSDSHFIGDAFVRDDQSSLVVFLNMVDSLAIGEELINVRAKLIGGARIDELEDADRAMMKFLGIVLIPLLISAYGVFRLWLRRKEEKLLKL